MLFIASSIAGILHIALHVPPHGLTKPELNSKIINIFNYYVNRYDGMIFSHQAIRLFLLRIEQLFAVLFGLAGITITQYGSHLSGETFAFYRDDGK